MSNTLIGYVWNGCASTGMKLSSVAIMARLADWCNDNGVCWPSVETIARQTGASISTVRKAIAQLEDEGWLTRKQRRKGNRNDSNVYQLNVSKLFAAAKPFQPGGDCPESDPSKSGGSGSKEEADFHPPESDASKFDTSKSDPSKNDKKESFHPPESGGDPSVNSNTDPSDQKISSSENSKKLSDEQKTRDFLARHPDAVVYTTAGKSWGTQEDLDCAGWIWERVKIINPTQRVPNWTEWANDVRLLRQIDGRTHKQICQLFKRANLDKFWCSNVLCPAKLREKWDVLTAKFNTGDFHAQTTGESNAMRQVREALDRWEQGDDPHRVGDGDENLRPVVDCEEWHCTGSDVGGADWEFDQRPDDERV